MASSRSNEGVGGSAEKVTQGLPGITQTDTTTAGLLARTAQEVVQNLSTLNSGIGGLSALQEAQAAAMQQNTAALEQNTQARGGGAANAVESAAESLLGGGGLLAPVLSGIMSLFGASSSQSSGVAEPFSLPAPIGVQATIASSGRSLAETTLNPGADSQPQTALNAPGPAPGASASGGGTVIVQVNAMDSRSFLDHKDEIAQAVRAAVLQSHALNDVLGEL
ncbi:MAG TPA: hypothetical protein VFA04_24350 [Bryobacteraceae bacterium]|nr:hypothetical protein [Bryobacteraceae bacterium]